MKNKTQNIGSSAPIGVFDSGIGGTSIWNEINQLLPAENSIYLADSKYAPYGIRSKEEIIILSDKNTALLLDKGCKIIVVACNTATTNAISYLRNKYNVGTRWRCHETLKIKEKGGARGRIRTTDTAIFSRLLYQLSYSGIWACAMRGPR